MMISRKKLLFDNQCLMVLKNKDKYNHYIKSKNYFEQKRNDIKEIEQEIENLEGVVSKLESKKT